MKWFLVSLAAVIVSLQIAEARAGAPIENLLEEADVVFIGRVSRASTNQVDFEVLEILRGTKEQAPRRFDFNSLESGPVVAKSVCLVLSSGPKAQPRASLGQPIKGPWDWIMLPVVHMDSSNVVDRAYSVRLSRRLTLEETKELVKRTKSQSGRLESGRRIDVVIYDFPSGNERTVRISDSTVLANVRGWIRSHAWPPIDLNTTGNVMPRGYFNVFDQASSTSPTFQIYVFAATTRSQPQIIHVSSNDWQTLLSLIPSR